jgi:predicted RNase H-like nuclease
MSLRDHHKQLAIPKTRAVLGIDAAWTLNQPSGVAVVRGEPNHWELVEVASSYLEFCTKAGCQLADQHSIAPADVLSAGSKLCGRSIDIVAVDMPLSRSPIVGRRPADSKVSVAYGAKKCGTHSPSATRPGSLSEALTDALARAGFPLLTEKGEPPGLIEVYPHPALIELAGAAERLPYKYSKVRRYWPSSSSSERRNWLYQQWTDITALLERHITGVEAALKGLPENASALRMKAYEDMLDAIVCAWVGTCFLEGKAIAFGDADSAIWIPKPT